MCNCYICRFFFKIISKLYIDMCIELFFLKFEICILYLCYLYLCVWLLFWKLGYF